MVVCTILLVVLAGAAHLYFKGQLEVAEAANAASAAAATAQWTALHNLRESQRVQEAQRWELDQKDNTERGSR